MAYIPPLNGGRLNASISGNTSGTASFLSTGTMFLAGGNNVTLSQSGNTISFNAPNGGAAPAIVGGGGTFSSGTLSLNAAAGALSIASGTGPALNFSVPAVSYLSGSGAVSLSTNGATVAISAPLQSVQTQNNIQALSAGTASAATGTIVFSNSNNINFGLNGQTLTASYAGAAGGAGSNTFGAGNAGNVSGNTGYISGSALQMALYGGNNVTLSQSISNSSATISIVGPTFLASNNVSIGISNNGVVTASASFSQSLQTSNIIQGISASGSSVNNGAVVFGNANGVTFGMSNATITASVTPDGIQAISASGSTQTAGGIYFSNSNNINFGMNGSTVTASYAGGAGGGVAVAGGGTTYTSGTAALAASGGVSLLSTTGQSLVVSAPGTSSLSALGAMSIIPNGSTLTLSAIPFDVGISGGNSLGINGSNSNGLYLAGGTNITLSGTSNATGALISVIGPTFSNANGVTFGTNGQTITASVAAGGAAGTIGNWEPVLWQQANFSTAQKYASNSLYFNKLQALANVSATQLQQLLSFGATTTTAGTNTYGFSMSAGIYTVSNSSLVLMTQSSGSTAFNVTVSSNNTSNIVGLKAVTLPMNFVASVGNYWLGIMSRSSVSSSSVSQSMSVYNVYAANTIQAPFANLINQAPNSTAGVQEGVGYYSTSVSTIQSSVPMSQIVQSNSLHGFPYVAFKNSTW